MNWTRDPNDTSSDFEEFQITDKGCFVFAFASELFPRLEWGEFLSSINISHALFRDSFDRWYHDGVHGLGNVDTLVEYMKSKRNQFSTTVALGLSKGSWAALKFGKLAGVDRVIAISVNSGCSREAIHEFPERWQHRVHDPTGMIEDLKPLYAIGPNPYIHAYVSDGMGIPSESPEVDRVMANRINADEITFIAGYTHGGQTNLGIGIRDNGILKTELLGLA